jgi:hypothetical protein
MLDVMSSGSLTFDLAATNRGFQQLAVNVNGHLVRYLS